MVVLLVTGTTKAEFLDKEKAAVQVLEGLLSNVTVILPRRKEFQVCPSDGEDEAINMASDPISANAAVVTRSALFASARTVNAPFKRASSAFCNNSRSM